MSVPLSRSNPARLLPAPGVRPAADASPSRRALPAADLSPAVRRLPAAALPPAVRMMIVGVLAATLGVGALAGAAPASASTAGPAAAGAGTRAQQAWGTSVVQEAARHAGKPYSWGASGPSTFDCSGFTSYVFARLGRTLPRTSGSQRAAVQSIPNDAKQPGDLIFTARGGRVTHVGIYAGGSEMWSPVQSGDHVRKQAFGHRVYTVGRVG